MPIYLAGPTAVGKTEVSLILAEKLGTEIISVDSMQVYQGLDIGTAKVSIAERQRIPHHLIDIVSPTEIFSAADFLRITTQTESELKKRGKVPIYCGGTGLYFKVLAYGLGESPPSDEALRLELEQISLSELLKELETKDPFCFQTIDKKNLRRVIRAVEVIRITGKPFSEQRSDWAEKPLQGTWVGLELPRDILYERINHRVDTMFKNGLVEETERMMASGLTQNPTAMQAIGYRQVVDYLENKQNLPATIELIKQKTRQFAKRQMTWFKHQLPLTWINMGRSISAEEAALTILQMYNNGEMNCSKKP